MSVEGRIKETLRAIKATPNSGSEELRLEPSVLNELRMRGYITAAVHTPLSGDQVFANIKITVPGELYLESLESPQPKETKPVPH